MERKLVESYASKYGLTPAAAEAEITRILMATAGMVACKFEAFASFAVEDVEQEAIIFGLEALARYDVGRPLANFLAVHMKNRLHNFKRDKYLRRDAPCSCCETFNPPAEPCSRWRAWHKRNSAKQSLAKPSLASPNFQVASRHERDEGEASFIREVDAWVDANLSASLRADYLRIKAGVSLTPGRHEAIRAAILGRFERAYLA